MQAPVSADDAVVVTLADGHRDLDGILSLQQENLAPNLPVELARSEGFVTVVHTRAILERMHALAPSVVARSGGKVVGYALTMPLECRHFLPVLEPMFAMLDRAAYEGSPLSRLRYYVMGQVCVARPFRGTGLFAALYRRHAASFADRFDLVVTEISRRNGRSLRAHERVGFDVVAEYRDATDDSVVVALDFRRRRERHPV
jgi:GNAT superfamily N-acetyltransferase